MASDTQDHTGSRIVRIISSIPLFAGLDDDERRLVYTICGKRSLETGEELCHEGSPSDSMFILILGKLAVRIKDSTTVSTVNPVGTIGEMGVFAGEKRSATVSAIDNCALLEIGRGDLDDLIGQHPVLGVKLMRNVIKTIGVRLRDHNVRIREFQNYIISQEDVIDSLKRNRDAAQ